MGSGRTGFRTLDLSSTASLREASSLLPNSPAKAAPLRHVLPDDLPTVIKYLDDQELDRLFAAVQAEQQRRGKKPHVPNKTSSEQPADAVGVSLTPGRLNAVRAAFKAGVTPARIAREFGISPSDVRKVIAGEAAKKAPSRG